MKGGIPWRDVVETVLRIAPHLEIAHHIPSRIRFRILPGGLGLARDIEVDRAAAAVPGVRSIRVNPFGRSVVIEYDPFRIPPDLWAELPDLRLRPERRDALTRRLDALGSGLAGSERAEAGARSRSGGSSPSRARRAAGL
ncbi:MAG: cation transporter [Deltaproteobacteria bacterium]|nr:cation transporter [Deltaproteobacteria bacterium]